MDGYRYWVLRHKLLVDLGRDKERAAMLPDAERQRAILELERDFRAKLDGLYAEVRSEFEKPVARA